MGGYEQDDNGNCTAQCNEPCVKGNCIRPDECECWPDHQQLAANICQKICEPDCTFGTCVDGTCVCDYGYEAMPNNSYICQVICDANNEECNYDDGEPLSSVCTPNCTNGFCTAFNTCECWDGYMDHNMKNNCEPMCEGNGQGCVNGTCVAPEHCQCFDGFVKSGLDDDFTCVPIVVAVVKETIDISAASQKANMEYQYLILVLLTTAMAFAFVIFFRKRNRKVDYNVEKRGILQIL